MRRILIGLLCAFAAAAVESATLPSGYVAVEYIESTRLGGQYIDTEYVHKSNTVIRCSVNVDSRRCKSHPAVFGAFDSGFERAAFVFFPKFDDNNVPALCRTGYEQRGVSASFPYGERIDLVCEGTQAAWRRNGAASDCGSINNTKAAADNGVCSMDIFVINSNGSQPDNSWCVMKLYSFAIYEGEELKRDFVPCIETASGKAGLYDTIEGKFHGNAGTGEFQTELPSGCLPVEYIESTAGGGQYINTGYTPNKNTKVVCRLRDDGTGASGDYGSIFGSRKGSSWERSMYFWLRRNRENEPAYGRAGSEGSLRKETFPFGEIATVTCQGRTCSWVHDAGTKNGGIELPGGYEESQEAGFAPLVIFALNSANEEGGCNPTDFWSFRLYSFKIFEGEVLKRDFVPCVATATGKPGLYDRVGGKLYSNDGSGDFRTTVSIPYWDPVTKSEKVAVCETITPSTSTFEDNKWYAALWRVACGTNVVNGAVNLILADGCSFTSDGGIEVDPGRSFTVYGQSGGTGTLTATGGSGRAGIGGVNLNAWEGYGSYGDITINGGVVNVKGGDGPAIGPWNDDGSAGIGGAMDNESGGTVAIHGGTVTAIGGINAPAIGGGHNVHVKHGNCGPVIIDGGAVDVRPGGTGIRPIGSTGQGTSGPITVTGGLFAQKPEEAWIVEGHRISDNCRPGTTDLYPWKVLKVAWVPVRLAKGAGVDDLLFRRDGEDEFEPFPAGGTELLVGAWVRIHVRSKPGYVYTGDVWFRVEESGLNETITSTAIGTDGDGSPERPWLVGDSVVAWTNGIGGLAVFGEGPMDDCIDAYGPIWTAFADDITELTVGGDVTAIGAGAFAGLVNLKKVTVSADQLVTIGDYAFADCWSLADLTLPNSVEEIGESAFEYCFDLRSCNLPKSLLAIGARAFIYCWTLTELDIPDSVISIDEQAFAGCSWIERLGLGSGLVWLGDSAFSDCTSIGAIAIRAEEPPFVGDKVFYFVPSSATLTVPAASVSLYKMAEGWKDFDVRPAADSPNETNPDATERVPLAQLASAALGAVGDKPPFEIVREGDVVRVTVRLPNALPGILYRLMGSPDLTFANPTEVVRGTAGGTGGLELTGTVPAGASCFFKVVAEGGNEE